MRLTCMEYLDLMKVFKDIKINKRYNELLNIYYSINYY